MSSSKYGLEQKILVKIIDLAIEAIVKFPPDKLDDNGIRLMSEYYLKEKDAMQNLPKKYQNLTSLNFTKADVLTYFQEGTGHTVEYFWQCVREESLPIARENRMAKILKRRKIKNQAEYDFVIDVFVPYQQAGMLSVGDVDLITKLISRFELSRKGE